MHLNIIQGGFIFILHSYDVKLDSYAGLGLIDIYIFPHFQRESEIMHKKTIDYETNNNTKITRLNDGEIIKYSYKNN